LKALNTKYLNDRLFMARILHLEPGVTLVALSIPSCTGKKQDFFLQLLKTGGFFLKPESLMLFPSLFHLQSLLYLNMHTHRQRQRQREREQKQMTTQKIPRKQKENR
jgi:hypothetical protein